MKHKSIWVMGVLLVVFIGIAATLSVVLLGGKKTTTPTSTVAAPAKARYTPPTACDVLTLDTAKKVVPGVVASDAQSSDVSSDSIVVSNCNYYDAANKISLGLLVRGARDELGAKTNIGQFDPIPAGAQSVSGYGDKAYWDPTFGQLNILKNRNWYILNNGPVMPASRTLGAAKKLADAVISKL